MGEVFSDWTGSVFPPEHDLLAEAIENQWHEEADAAKEALEAEAPTHSLEERSKELLEAGDTEGAARLVKKGYEEIVGEHPLLLDEGEL